MALRPLRNSALAAAALLAAGPAVARSVVYLSDMAAIRAAAEDQGIAGPFAEPPGPDSATIALETPAVADHRVIVASLYCQAYHIENPVSSLLRDLATAANQAPPTGGGAADRPVLTLHILSGSTVLRCMGKNDLEAICKNRVRITAEARFARADGSTATIPLTAQVEREGRVGGFCGNIARYTGIVTREAAIDLIAQARAASAQ